jgi:hypothetical protein
MDSEKMENTPSPTPLSRIGFHYFPDSMHYRESDLDFWLPELKALGSSWLVIQSPIDRAIPEPFIYGLCQAGIEPIIQFDLSLSNPPNPADLLPLLESYARWGARLTLLYDRPNLRSAWSSTGWVQQDLVERFLDRYIPLAEMTLQSGLKPISPTLEPGGNYWDLAFLRTMLESLERRQKNQLLDNLILSAYSWTQGHSLNWGSGGPEHWPEARPYFTPVGEQDHRGFRIFDWYEAIAKARLGKECPIILLQAGVSADPLKTKGSVEFISQHAEINLAIARLLNGDYAADLTDPQILLEPISLTVQACNFWLLADDPTSRFYSQAWYQDEGQELPAVKVLKDWLVLPKHSEHHSVPADVDADEEDTLPISHYLLLPTFNGSVADWHLNLIHPFIKKYLPTVGFSIEEASLAKRVTVIGDEQAFPEGTLEKMRQSGSLVERIDGVGTSIATQLAER